MTVKEWILGPTMKSFIELSFDRPYYNERLHELILKEFHKSPLAKDTDLELDVLNGCYGECVVKTLTRVCDFACHIDPAAWDVAENPLGKMVWHHMEIVVYG